MQDTRNAAVDGTAATDRITFNTDYTTSSIESKEVSEKNLKGITRKPIRFLKCTPETIPQSLQNINNWILWKCIPKEDGKLDKLPLSLNYTKIGAAPENGNSFDKTFKKLDINHCNGLGFILGTHHLVAVDVDHCIDENGTFSTLAQQLMEKLPTYVEYSQSRQGLHFIFRDEDVPEDCPLTGHRNAFIEIYTHKRYIALTGWRVENTPSEVRTLNVMHEEFMSEYFPSLGYASDVDESELIQNHTYTPIHSNEEILQQMKHDDKFQRLFYDGCIEDYPSQSEADGALMLKLAQATYLCAPQMRELFSQSALGKRDKWSDPWYQDYVISGAIQYAKSGEVNPSSLAAFTLITFNDSINLTDQIFTYAAICKNNLPLAKYYEVFRKYCKQHKSQLNISMNEFDTQIKLAESRLELEQIEQHNRELSKLETLTLPAPYNNKNWIIPEGYRVNVKGTWAMSPTGYKKNL